jgi:hypothetical protein
MPTPRKSAALKVIEGTGQAVFDCDVSGPGGGGVMEISSTRIAKGGPIRVSSFSISIPSG